MAGVTGTSFVRERRTQSEEDSLHRQPGLHRSTVHCTLIILLLGAWFYRPWQRRTVLFSSEFFPGVQDNSQTAALSWMTFCTNMYLDNPTKPIKFQGHFFLVDQSLPNCFHRTWKKSSLVTPFSACRLLDLFQRYLRSKSRVVQNLVHC